MSQGGLAIRIMAYAAAAFFGGSSVTRAAPLLMLDFNDRTAGEPTPPGTTPNDPANIETGFTGFTLDNNGTTVNGVKITLTAVPNATGTAGTLDDRDRSRPTDSGAFTYGEIYDDFIFIDASGASGGTEANGGINLRLENLTPGQEYEISIYAYDADSPGSGGTSTTFPASPRTASYTANGAPLFTTTFDGNVLPTTNDQYKDTGVGVADVDGVLLIAGRRVSGDRGNNQQGAGVFLNGLELTAVPEPSTAALIGLAGVAALRCRRRV